MNYKHGHNRRNIRFNQFWFKALDLSGRKVFSNNQNEFARRYGLNQGHISECLNGKRKTCKGWRFIR